MSCACQQKKFASEYERIKRLAKATAELRAQTIVLYRNENGTYNFTTEEITDKEIVEYISPY